MPKDNILNSDGTRGPYDHEKWKRSAARAKAKAIASMATPVKKEVNVQTM